MKAFERITMSSPDILKYPAAQRVLRNLEKYNLFPENYEGVPDVVDTYEEGQRITLEAVKRQGRDGHPVALGKRILHLTTQPGVFLKSCPGSNNMLCCHYHIVNMVSNCPFDCSYCYLQTYLNQPMTTIYVNEDDIFNQVREICARPPVDQLRIGTGEIADSLALDPLTGFSERLAEVMAEFPKVRLELKTKSKNVEHLLHIPKKDHVIISWSMNPPEVINAEEHGTARFEERVAAAALAAKAGFNIGFHFDPMIYREDWETIYPRAVDAILDAVPAEKIHWISLGALRYQPQLKSIALKRRPETTLFLDESVMGEDGKMRYLRQHRTEMFSKMNAHIQNRAPGLNTYLCMETMPVWQNAMGKLPDRGF